MQVRIGVQSVPKELVIETSLSPQEVSQALENALATPHGVLELTGEKGGRILIPASGIGYLELEDSGSRQVGFGSSF